MIQHHPADVNSVMMFHPQTHGQSETITMYLCCLVGDQPCQWVQWLLWAEFCYNSAYQALLRTSPFRVVYGHDPPTVHTYIQGSSWTLAVNQQLADRDEFLAEIQDRLE
jgi:hypothetical protein